MAAPWTRCCQQASLRLGVWRGLSRASGATAPPAPPPPAAAAAPPPAAAAAAAAPPPPSSLRSRLLLALTRRYYDVEMLLNWTRNLKRKSVLKKNGYYYYTKKHFGENIASAYFVLNMKGAFRYAGQSEWFRPNSRGKFSWDFMLHKDSVLEEIDMSHTVINRIGLGNLVGNPLRTLSLCGCPEVDDWALAKLHLFQDTLEELDISNCPQITIGGLAALRNVKGLRRLNVSSLTRVSNPGLVVILLEEMLPRCQVTAVGYDLSTAQKGGNEEEEDQGQDEQRLWQRWRTG